jgi:transposase, IS30 family
MKQRKQRGKNKQKDQQEKGQKKYTHIKKAERSEIAILLKKGYGVRDIAQALHRGIGTISDEIHRNRVKGIYDPVKADHKAYVKRKYSKYQGMKVVQNRELWNYVEDKLKQDWSPEEIAGRIKHIDTHIPYASYQAMYTFVYSVYGRRLERCLRYKGRKKRGVPRQKVGQLENRIFIEKRPNIVAQRKRFGDWEGDFIVSGKSGTGVLLVLHERKARYTIIRKIMAKSPALVNWYLQEMFSVVVCFNSLTLDNDIVFRKHEELSLLLGKPVYFCHPYHSWEKGSVENTNKLIRQYIPKGSDISQYTDKEVQDIENKLNHRPRKCLDYHTPLEVMMKNKQLKTVEQLLPTNVNKKAVSVRLEG